MCYIPGLRIGKLPVSFGKGNRTALEGASTEHQGSLRGHLGSKRGNKGQCQGIRVLI